MTDLSALAGARYISVTSFRRDGTPVATPVWLAPDGAGVSFISLADQGKIKRIRNNPAVTVAPCTIRGRLLGAPAPARAELLPPAETARVRKLLRKRYGLLGWLVLQGRDDASVAVRVTPS